MMRTITIGPAILLLVGWLATGACSSSDSNQASSGVNATEHRCGDDQVCQSDEFCVATQGAVCMPLPPPGEECEEGCVLTEHCCNCTVFACSPAPESACPDGPSCECLETGFLDEGCPPDRRECTETEQGVDVLCISVALDEDPFADAGTDE